MVATLAGKAVVAKLGMDAHWRGVIVVAHALRDAGMVGSPGTELEFAL